jgi:hypothetical protein
MLHRTPSIALGLILFLSTAKACCQAGTPALTPRQDAPDIIFSKLGPPEKSTIAVFKESGMRDMTVHTLTNEERATIANAIAGLPPVYQKVLVERLNRISFVDGIPGVGTGLTGKSDSNPNMLSMTFRADILHQSASAFLTWKEQQCFMPDRSNYQVSINAGDVGAFTYVLLHEATHVVDFSRGFSAQKSNPFHVGIWSDKGKLLPPYDAILMSGNEYRTGKPFGMSQAPDVYRSLAMTPFVDLYGSHGEQDDLAELAAFYVLSKEFQTNPTVEVRDGNGTLVYEYQSLKSARVQARLPIIEQFLKPSS